jgi:AbrB family looped-hinge helix DNA binding protein
MPGGFAEGQKGFESEVPERLDLKLGPGGRVVIPAAYRKAMQVEEGDRLMARVVDGELRLITPKMGIKLAQKMVRETVRGKESLIDTLMEMRREELEDELGSG